MQRVHSLSARRAVQVAATLPGLTAVILNLDRPDLILPLMKQAPLIAGAFEARGLRFEMLVGDTGSTDEEVARRTGGAREVSDGHS